MHQEELATALLRAATRRNSSAVIFASGVSGP